MPKRGELYNAMVKGSSTDALMFTCMHLHAQTTQIMEDDWIVFSALIGKTQQFLYGSLWNQINKRILNFIDAEEVDAKDAMVCTVELMLLYKRCNKDNQPFTINILRQKVIHLFPEKAVLSAAGFMKYKQILSVLNDISQNENNTESDVSLFCQRILAGLSKVMSENTYEDMRNSLEYLCKKKIAIPLPTLYPCPNMEEAERGDIIWFLWGALMCFYGDKNGKYDEVTKDIVFTNYTLFVSNWKRISNKERIGLLWGVPYALNTNIEPDWTYSEKIILDKLHTNAVQIWKSFLDEQITNDEDESSLSNQLDVLSTYIPRTNSSDDTYLETDTYNANANNVNATASVTSVSSTYLSYNIQKANEYENKLKESYDEIEKTVPFIRTLYIDKSSKFTTSTTLEDSNTDPGSASGSASKSKSKSKNSTNKSSIYSQLEKTESLIKAYDSKYGIN